MAINDILDAVISSVSANQSTLNSLLNQIKGETLYVDGPNQDPPVVDENGVWTLTQSTANDGSDYVGVYRLPETDLCATIFFLTVIQPTSPLPTARVLPCGADPVTGWINLISVNDLVGQSFNKFEIRSSAAFEIRVQVKRFAAVGVFLGSNDPINTNFEVPDSAPFLVVGAHGDYDASRNVIVATLSHDNNSWLGFRYNGLDPSATYQVTVRVETNSASNFGNRGLGSDGVETNYNNHINVATGVFETTATLDDATYFEFASSQFGTPTTTDLRVTYVEIAE